MDILLDALRTLTYLWVSLEAFFLAHLYWYGYGKYKNSPIIKWLQRVFVAIGLLFGFYAFLPVFKITQFDVYFTAVNIGTFFVVLLGVCMMIFRQESLHEEMLPKTEVEKDIHEEIKTHSKICPDKKPIENDQI